MAQIEVKVKDDQRIDPQRVIDHVGFDEISLKKPHKRYVTLMTDLTDPDSPKVLALAKGRHPQAGTRAAAEECLGKLTADQRAAVQRHRVDMGKVVTKRCYGVKSSATL
jgi:hypothetical protein